MVPPLAGPVSEGRKRWNHPSSSDIIFKVNTALPVFALVFGSSLLLRLPLKVVLLGIEGTCHSCILKKLGEHF